MKDRETRVKAVLPIRVEGRPAGLTRDVSPNGVFFETEEEMKEGSPIVFSIELDTGGERFLMQCEGQIVRVENQGGKKGVAARIVVSKLMK